MKYGPVRPVSSTCKEYGFGRGGSGLDRVELAEGDVEPERDVHGRHVLYHLLRITVSGFVSRSQVSGFKF